VDGYRRALELNPEFPAAHDNLGLVYMDEGSLAEAVACFRRAIELSPGFAGAHNNRLTDPYLDPPDAAGVEKAIHSADSRWGSRLSPAASGLRPVVTLVGSPLVGRAGLSQLTNLGLPELIASSPEQYVQTAVELAHDLPRLSHLRATLRDRMRASPIMDAPRFARDLEAAYRQMWRRWRLR